MISFAVELNQFGVLCGFYVYKKIKYEIYKNARGR